MSHALVKLVIRDFCLSLILYCPVLNNFQQDHINQFSTINIFKKCNEEITYIIVYV